MYKLLFFLCVIFYITLILLLEINNYLRQTQIIDTFLLFFDIVLELP